MDTDNLWVSKPPSTREELERVVRREKIDALASWLEKHFTCDQRNYIEKSPILILKGASGCGKTTTLRLLANELGIPIKEYHDTVDDTAVYNATKPIKSEFTTFDFDKRQANKFEQFVLNNLKFSNLSAFEQGSSNSSTGNPSTSQTTRFQTRELSPTLGVIILAETPMSIVRSRNVLIETMFRLRQQIKQLSKRIRRRVAIIFETLENDAYLLLPAKTKQQLQIDIIAFNPVTKTNLVKLIKSFIGERVLDKEQINTIVNQCDGDVRSCINSLQIMFQHKFDLNEIQFAHPSKAKRIKHDTSLNIAMLKGENLHVNFFHILGKIFYQKRIYPDVSYGHQMDSTRYRPNVTCGSRDIQSVRSISIDRPYPTENSSESILEMLDVSPDTLISWLHHNYSDFCDYRDVDKASTFIENLSCADMISLNMFQSTQFFESQHLKYICDQVQSIIAIESTTFSLYTDNSNKETSNSNRKKIIVNGKTVIVKSSVDHQNKTVSFEKPPFNLFDSLHKNYEFFVEKCSIDLMMIDRRKVCLDYMPYGSDLFHPQGFYQSICEKYNSFNYARSINDYENLDLELKNIIDDYSHKVSEEFMNEE